MATFWHDQTNTYAQFQDSEKERAETLKKYLHNRHYCLILFPDFYLFTVPSDNPLATLQEISQL